jgi:murein DD-endopeptidase MepM/ murein hydrolase activator NlpD
MRPLLARAAACAILVTLLIAPTASARPADGFLRRAAPAQAWKLDFAWPASGTVTDGFGPRWGRMHRGVDIGILRSLRVGAAMPGVVRTTGRIRGYEGYGNVVIVDVGHGYRTLYAHLSTIGVHRGQHVRGGQKLGRAGCTGSCTGTHLHFELRKGERAVNPSRFLPRYTSHREGA